MNMQWEVFIEENHELLKIGGFWATCTLHSAIHWAFRQKTYQNVKFFSHELHHQLYGTCMYICTCPSMHTCACSYSIAETFMDVLITQEPSTSKTPKMQYMYMHMYIQRVYIHVTRGTCTCMCMTKEIRGSTHLWSIFLRWQKSRPRRSWNMKTLTLLGSRGPGCFSMQ